MPFRTIRYAAGEGIASITLDRPERQNRLTAETLTELRDAFRAVAAGEGIRAVLLDAAGDDFCAGRATAGARPVADAGAAMDTHGNPLVRAIRGLERPVVCAVRGDAAGAGANLALACDIVVAGRSARFTQDDCARGGIPEMGGTWLLPRLAGPGRAFAVAVLGQAVGAEEAARWGLIWRCVDDGQLAAESRRLVATLAAMPAATLGLVKRAMDIAGTKNLEDQLDVERDFLRMAARMKGQANKDAG